MAPFLLKVAQRIAEAMPEVRVALSISPFVSDTQLQKILSVVEARTFGVAAQFTPGTASQDGKTDWEKPGEICTENGLRVIALRGRQYDLMNTADLALTIPGTNSVELSFIGTPAIVTIPLTHPERIPLEGLPGLIGTIPVLGKAFMRYIVPRIAAGVKYTAWPNRLADEYVFPELRGKVTADDVREAALGLLKDPERRVAMSVRLQQIVGAKGASVRLVELLAEVLTRSYGESWRNDER
jgi:lipid-A-disaccharide synthase